MQMMMLVVCLCNVYFRWRNLHCVVCSIKMHWVMFLNGELFIFVSAFLLKSPVFLNLKMTILYAFIFKWWTLYCVLVVEMSQELKHSSCLDSLQQILVSWQYSWEEKEKRKYSLASSHLELSEDHIPIFNKGVQGLLNT